MTLARVWCAMPWTDCETGNWSLMRSVVVAFTACICHAIEHTHTVTWPIAFVIGTLIVGALSKNVTDFAKGAQAIWQRRKSDTIARPAEDITG